MKVNLRDLKRLSNSNLPGEFSHRKMSPRMRQGAADIRAKGVDFKESAVLVMLYERDNEIFIPLIERNTYDGTHSGQISFPGGRMEDQDNDLMETALRETHEEIGVSLSSGTIVKELSEIYIPPSNFMVSPFVSVVHDIIEFKPDPYEVVNILQFPLESLLDEQIIRETRVYVKKYNAHLKVPAFIHEEKVIWGATAIILSELKDMIMEL